jgi:hypothetical protein
MLECHTVIHNKFKFKWTFFILIFTCLKLSVLKYRTSAFIFKNPAKTNKKCIVGCLHIILDVKSPKQNNYFSQINIKIVVFTLNPVPLCLNQRSSRPISKPKFRSVPNVLGCHRWCAHGRKQLFYCQMVRARRVVRWWASKQRCM